MFQPPLIQPEPRASGLGSGNLRLGRAATLERYLYGVELLLDETISLARFDAWMSKLRRLVIASVTTGGPPTALLLSEALDRAAGMLVEPGQVPASDVWSAWAMFADFIRRMVKPPAEAGRRIAAIEARFRPREVEAWHQEERVPGGYRRPTEGHRKLLQMVDLLGIRERAGKRKRGEQRLRDRAILGMAMGSGQRWQEIVSRCWEHLAFDPNPEGKPFPISVRVERRGRDVELPIHVSVAADLVALYRIAKRAQDRSPQGPIFRQLRFPYGQLGVREAQGILAQAAATSPGCAGATLLDLRAAFADHLIATYGVTELELTEILGYGEHKHVRALIRQNKAWRLNERVDAAEHGGTK